MRLHFISPVFAEGVPPDRSASDWWSLAQDHKSYPESSSPFGNVVKTFEISYKADGLMPGLE
jgi:hypothetical protein